MALTDQQANILNVAEAIFDARVTSSYGTTEGAFQDACSRLNVPCDWSNDWPALCYYLTRYAKHQGYVCHNGGFNNYTYRLR